MKNKSPLTNEDGMSLVELVVVLAVISGMALLSIPAFKYLRQYSAAKNLSTQVETLNASIARWSMKRILDDSHQSFPEILDENPVQNSCQNCFDKVLPKGVEDSLWYKESSLIYYYSANTNTGDQKNYKESGDFKITYNPIQGHVSFVQIP